VSAFLSKMSDVVDFTVLTFGNCALKAGMIKWPVKLYVYFTFLKTFFTFFFKIQKHDFLRFLSCCTRFLEH